MIDRRLMIGGLMASGAMSAVASKAAGRTSTGRLMSVRGTRLWVDDSGPRNAPALVYMHGGPGVGALDFETYMKPVLADRIRLISIDQRGVLRSDALAKDLKVSPEDIVADFEDVRKQLGVERWQVLGHSFGGLLAVRYALAHPARVTRLSLENPAYDATATSHWLAAAAAQALNGIAPEAAVTADRLANPTTVVDASFFDKLGSVMAALGPRRQDLFIAQSKKPRHVFTLGQGIRLDRRSLGTGTGSRPGAFALTGFLRTDDSADQGDRVPDALRSGQRRSHDQPERDCSASGSEGKDGDRSKCRSFHPCRGTRGASRITGLVVAKPCHYG
ncbi:alpha/beta fold hydrolase [Sphingomonas faeni]|uniref:alpha/beta fold hydrolase n=1 Tax=Sphingomonas faeni TaxID=185950 RepID=UPI00334EC3B3